MQDIFEQVDEQLDAERVQKFWEKNGKWVIAVLILFFLGMIAYVQWREYRIQQSQSASEQFMVARDFFDKQDHSNGQKQLQMLLDTYSGHGYAHLGRFLQARSLVETGKTKQAVQQMELLIQEAGSSPLAELALLNLAYLTAGDAQRAQTVLTRIPTESPYKAHALELQGLLDAQKGENKSAVARYQAARALTSDASLRRRLEDRLARLSEEKNP